MSEATGTVSRPPSAARERILDTADRLFYDEGIHAVGIQRIVAEAAVTRVTLYRHFPSKDDLISAYLERESASTTTRSTGSSPRIPTIRVRPSRSSAPP